MVIFWLVDYFCELKLSFLLESNINVLVSESYFLLFDLDVRVDDALGTLMMNFF
jgi:hypothetical protein